MSGYGREALPNGSCLLGEVCERLRSGDLAEHSCLLGEVWSGYGRETLPNGSCLLGEVCERLRSGDLAEHSCLLGEVSDRAHFASVGDLRRSKGQMKTILVVCTGNICRSPMAMGLLREKLHKEGLEGEYRVHSAGVWGLNSQPPSTYSSQMMAQRGIDISDHRSRDLTAEDVEEADLILTMERGQAEAISLEFPQHAHKVHLLSQMIGRRYDIGDPYGGSLLEYRQCAAEIERIIEEGYPRIMELVG